MSQGMIVQCIGAVVDIQFPREAMPKVYDALMLDVAEEHANIEKGLTSKFSNSWVTALSVPSPWVLPTACAAV